MKIIYLSVLFVLLSCSVDEPEQKNSDDSNNKTAPVVNTKPESVDKSDLVKVVGDTYTEYYPGKKVIKFQGPQDGEGKRHGKWLYFSQTGIELSMTMYEHGKKHGHSIVKYPNGTIHYIGEYSNDVQVGEWKTYTTEGKMYEVKDFGSPEN